MLVYEKLKEDARKLFGTDANIPAEDDLEVIYTDENGEKLTDVDFRTQSFVDDGHGGIIRVSDNKFVAMFLKEEDEYALIPLGWKKPEKPQPEEKVEEEKEPEKEEPAEEEEKEPEEETEEEIEK